MSLIISNKPPSVQAQNGEAEKEEEDAISLSDHPNTPYFRARVLVSSSEQIVAEQIPEKPEDEEALSIKKEDSVKDI